MKKLALIVTGLSLAMLSFGVIAQDKPQKGEGCKDAKPACPVKAELTKALDDAIAAVNAGEKEAALTALEKIKATLANCQQACKAADCCPKDKCKADGKACGCKDCKCCEGCQADGKTCTCKECNCCKACPGKAKAVTGELKAKGGGAGACGTGGCGTK